MNMIYLSLGSNLGRRQQHIEEALKLIQNRIGGIEHVSRFYESEPWGFSSAYNFCNCCLALRTTIDPLPLMDRLLEIEQEMGRLREGMGYSDRVIDIDMLFYGDKKMDHPRLILPHPSMGDRRFVLAPLAEIAPQLIHPVAGINITQMLQACTDQSDVVPLTQE
jgi:2-amino-4-hydroxy-6-hydroxymethyldihydropteridine diphosphokinase